MQLSKSLTLRHNFSWTLIGHGTYAASQWGILVLLAKLGTPTMIGQFTLGLAITAPIFLLTNLQLRAIQATDAKQRYSFSDYLTLRLVGTSVALLAVLAILLTGYSQETSLVILLIALAKAMECVSDVFYGLFQQREQMDRMAFSLILRGCLSFIAVGISLYITHQIVWAVVGLTVVWTLVLISCDLRNGISILSKLNFQWNGTTLKKLFRLALPMGIVTMLISLNGNIPRYLIERHLGERDLGIFAALAYLIVVGSTIVNALGQAAAPRLAKYYAKGNRKAFFILLLKLLGIGAGLGAITVAVALVAGREILTILYQPEYAQHTDLLVGLMVAGGISYVASFLNYGMTAAQYFIIQLPLFMIVTAVSALSCLWLLPSFGLYGVAIALSLAALVQVVTSLGVVLHAMRKIPKSL